MKRVLDLEISSPHPLPEAIRRVSALHARSEQLLASRRDILARVTERDGTATVYLHRDAGRNIIAEIRGELRPSQAGSVLAGTASIHPITWFLPIAVMCILPLPLGAVFFIGGSDGPPPVLLLLGVPFALLGLGLLYWQSTRNRAQLIQTLTDALR